MRLIIPVFVDDITIAGKDKAAIQRVKDDLRKHFKLCDLGPTSWLLGVKIERDRSNRSLSISQRQYALDVLQRYGFANCDPVSTPMDPGLRLSSDMAPSSPSDVREMQDIPYNQAVGSLFYLAVAMRPDIARTVGQPCSLLDKPWDDTLEGGEAPLPLHQGHARLQAHILPFLRLRAFHLLHRR